MESSERYLGGKNSSFPHKKKKNCRVHIRQPAPEQALHTEGQICNKPGAIFEDVPLQNSSYHTLQPRQCPNIP